MTKPASDRDADLERLLARTLEARAGEATGALTPACVDAEMAAAWADGTLSAVEREAIETHAADCGRCQALLAAMVTTAPPDAASRRSVWRMPALGWLIPAATAAAAVIAWFVIPGRPTGLRPPVVATAPGASAAAPPAATASREATVAPEKDQRPAASASKATPRSLADARDTALAPQQRTTEDRKKETTAESNGGVAALAKTAPQPDHRVEAKAAPASPPAAPPRAGAPPDATPAPGRMAAAPPAGAGGGLAGGRGAAPMNAAVGAGATAAAPVGSARTTVVAESITPAVIVSADSANRWRILPGGGVERSVDGGSTWEAQTTGSTVTLSAGTSPSSTVCWLVGRAGIVLLSTDGHSWKRLAFPETVDLVAITAIDGKTATVTAADGRRFTTSDAGGAWTPVR